MSEIKSESVSSLVDNYSPSTDDSINEHLVENLLKDEELAGTWQNYHLIGDVLRDEVPDSLSLDLSESIADAIAQEATILSPNSTTQTTFSQAESTISASAAASKITSDVVDSAPSESKNPIGNNVVEATNRFKAKLNKLVKPLGQVAIAASAAGLMIVGVQQNVADNSVTPAPVVQTIPLSGYANPVSFSVQPTQGDANYLNAQQAQQAKNEKIVAERVAQQRRLQALLKDHNQQVKLGSN